jgi:uncharacterized protein YydD (DUF2326 family)
MITSITADADSFKDVGLEPGFNVVLAERTDEDAPEKGSDRQSTNGSGKTLLLEICQFCLGADASRTPLVDAHLAGWTFTIGLRVRDRQLEVSRSIAEASRVVVAGELADWPIEPRTDSETGRMFFQVDDWTASLGAALYGLDLDSEESKFRPSFRTLVSYAIRRGLDAYGDPFSYFRGQRAWQKNVANAYFLGLDWRIYQQTQALRKNEENVAKAIEGINRAFAGGAFGGATGLGDLEARAINLEREVREAKGQLETFQVHPRYHEYEQQATNLTASIHELVANAVSDRETLEFYEGTVRDEAKADAEDIETVYSEAGVLFPEQVMRRLEDAREFHEQLVRNRQSFLSGEISRLKVRIEEYEEHVARLTNDRAEVLSFLQEHGALEEYTRLQRFQSEQAEELGRLRGQIEQLRGYEESLGAIRVELEQLKLSGREDLDEKRGSWGRVVELFGQFTSELYEKPGQLVVDVASNGGLSLDVDIERGASQGVQEMTVFCYDLALATALAERGQGPRLLFHDSTIFDGVDPRQKATALKLAERQSRSHNFQYLMCINQGDVPWKDLGDWNLSDFVRRELTDVGDGGLLGIRY